MHPFVGPRVDGLVGSPAKNDPSRVATLTKRTKELLTAAG